ncbi:MAG: ImmA/IrrE family metallo-endopeptidase [Saccharothrix sp.]|nr:ImmA/IrrE family metallo-endopeptidase [Saccharothrix sp.]
MDWSDIGDRVRECRLAARMSQDDLARAVGLERSVIAKVEAGTRKIDAVELARLSTTLDVPLGHFLSARSTVLSRRAELVEDTDSDVARRSYRLEAKLSAWVRDIRQLTGAGALELPTLLAYDGAVTDADRAREAARWTRDRLGLGSDPIESLMTVCEAAGQLVLVTDLPGEGASLRDGDVAAAVVSRELDPGRRRATAAHELGHLVLGDEYSSDLGVSASRADREMVIDAYAAELLLPSQVVADAVVADGVRRMLITLAARYRTSWSLAVGQASYVGVVDQASAAGLSPARPTRAELLDAVGWAPQPDLDAVRVPPGYAHAVMGAWRSGAVTAARAVELMHGQITREDLPHREEADLAT